MWGYEEERCGVRKYTRNEWVSFWDCKNSITLRLSEGQASEKKWKKIGGKWRENENKIRKIIKECERQYFKH